MQPALCLSIGQVLFSEDWLDQKARETGFVKRKSRKIDPLNLRAALVEESPQGSPSYNDLASSIESNEDADPSRQAVALRLNEPSRISLRRCSERSSP